MSILTAIEISELIEDGITDAKQELRDNGQTLSVEYMCKNGDNTTTKAYGKRIDSSKYNKNDLLRHNRLKLLTGVAS